MTTAVQRRRGTKTEHESFTGLEGEITVNTTNESLHVHDGSTTGGFETMRADGSNATSLNLNSTTNVDGVIDDDTMATASATKLATAESIKAYVDNQVATVDTLSEVLGNGNTSGANNLIISSGQALTTNTISETTLDTGVTIDSVLLKDNGVIAASINIGSSTLVDGVLDEDTLVSNSATKLATQQSIKAYVDGQSYVTDGDKGDVVVSSSGAVWTVESAAGDFDVGGSLTGAAASFTTIESTDLGGITISSAAARMKFIETDGTSAYAATWLDQNGDVFAFRTFSSGGSVVSNDYRMLKGASGVIEHEFLINGSEKLSLDSTGLNVVNNLDVGGIATIENAAPILALNETGIASEYSGTWFVLDGANMRIQTRTNAGAQVSNDYQITKNASGATAHIWSIADSDAARIDSARRLLVGKTTANAGSTAGTELEPSGLCYFTRSGAVLVANRIGSDGDIVLFRQAGIDEGGIAVSGTTVSYNGAHLSRWSQWEGAKVTDSEAEGRPEVLRGSILSNVDEMCEWFAVEWEENIPDKTETAKHHELYDGAGKVGDVIDYTTESGEVVKATIVKEDNEQLNRTKISDVAGDKSVSGVFQGYDLDDDTAPYDFYCAMTGDFVIRIGKGVKVKNGDLIESAGDGTGRPQADDLIRSSTVAKVTSTNVTKTYDDGSYLVPCVLMAC